VDDFASDIVDNTCEYETANVKPISSMNMILLMWSLFHPLLMNLPPLVMSTLLSMMITLPTFMHI